MKILSRVTENKDIASKEYVDDNIPVVVRDTVTISNSGTSVIQIPFTIDSTNSLTVHYRGLLLVQGTHYTATTNSITLIGFTADAGDLFTFTTGVVTSSALPASAIAFSDTTVDNCYGDCTSVQDALVLSATRDYVDNSIGTAITTALAGDY